ncbi:GntR family transcriptional regulator [Lampropedia puyangensis]|uniref:GntR family transcriptional regulator n=1 Tax=Lampropedia puyangensis TaxID=1330072 RepID=A0A4S8F4L8_9BURK|nr:GntR family transcriptional regulator [Lampropedia puyangensis]THU01455.1 GntR family transcriptional regulator [Lampropedia puyangensis]
MLSTTERGKTATEPLQPAPAEAPLSDETMHARMVNAILEHRLPPGTRLAEDRLAQIFGVSRTRIRPVLTRLAHDRLIVLRPHRSPEVASPTQTDALEVFEARRLIEPRLVQGFIDCASEAQVKTLRQCIREEHAALLKGDRHSAIRLSGQFHLAIAAGAKQQTLADILHDLISRTSLVLMLYGGPGLSTLHNQHSTPSHYQESCREHERLVDAIALRDANMAKQLILEHLQDLEATLQFSRQQDSKPDLSSILG